MDTEELCSFLCQELPRTHLDRLLGAVESAFHISNQHLTERFDKVPRSGPGPQSHHYHLQEALLNIPPGEGFSVTNQATRPAGGHYALVNAGALKLTASVITMDRAPAVRDARFRRDLRQLNERLQQQHPDLFNSPVPPFGPQEDSLHALLLPYTAKWSEADHSKPLACIIAIPHSDNSRHYHLRKDVSELWKYYEEGGGVTDIAYPKLRDKMRAAETGGNAPG
ncbi:hypothetical protein ACG1BZ_14905 [Microbulbifer sp. CNSA002]|uniref:hypothetical protein n=1 Tax=Microbulbifer sp. CNSA002 TaxID=3373604 RepID=UPI0039B60DEB